MREFSKNEDFIFEIIHDLKSPIMSIDFALKNMERNEILDEIYKINKHNLNYVENLLTGYSLSKGKYCPNFEIVDLAKVVKDELQVLNFLIIEKNLKIEITYEDNNEAYSLTDKALSRQIILNLLTNAVKYTKPNKTIKISFFNKNKFLNICFQNDYDKTAEKICSSKMGLNIIKKKIKALRAKFNITKKDGIICFNIGFKQH